MYHEVSDADKTYPSAEILAFPLLDGGLRFKIAQIIEVKTLVFAVQLLSALLTAHNDSVNIVIDEQAL